MVSGMYRFYAVVLAMAVLIIVYPNITGFIAETLEEPAVPQEAEQTPDVLEQPVAEIPEQPALPVPAPVLELYNENLPWRPGCANDPGVPPGPWKESYNDNKKLGFCLYADAIFFEVPVFTDFDGKFTRGSYADAYINEVNYNNIDPVYSARLEFKYNIPFYEDGSECFDEAAPKLYDQLVFVSSQNSEGFNSEGFIAAGYTLSKEEKKCGVWLQFNHSITGFTKESDFFDFNSPNIGAIGFEFANVYVKDIHIVGNNGDLKVW
ncbi:MAG: hypothetical protein HYW25_05885 [Candidatus Aenigmarchaeota archaeon]|nr:hypothetical protein [Candidatus Aenigmarchaeota archaeon]